MPEKDEAAQSKHANWLRRTLPLETETTRFILVSVFDIVMTYMVIRYSQEGRTEIMIGEGNPLPAMFISRWGIPGMVVFKMIIVAFVAVLAQVIAHFSILKARFMLNFGTVIVSFVVLYSLWLLLGVWIWN